MKLIRIDTCDLVGDPFGTTFVNPEYVESVAEGFGRSYDVTMTWIRMRSGQSVTTKWDAEAVAEALSEVSNDGTVCRV